MKKIIIFILMCSLFFVSGCIVNNKVEGSSQQRIIVTPSGSEVIIPSDVTRYAVLNQSNAQTLVDLGFENKIVAVNKESLYLGNFNHVEVVFDKSKPNMQELVDVKPQVIIIDDKTLENLSDDAKTTLDTSCIPLIILNTPKTIEDMEIELKFLVDLTDAEYGQALIHDFDEKLAKIERLQQARGNYILGYVQISDKDNKTISIGSKTFISDALEKAGIVSIYNDKDGYITATKEYVVEKNPQVFIVISNDENIRNNIMKNKVYENIDAIKNGNVIIIKKYEIMNANYKALDWILEIENEIYR